MCDVVIDIELINVTTELLLYSTKIKFGKTHFLKLCYTHSDSELS